MSNARRSIKAHKFPFPKKKLTRGGKPRFTVAPSSTMATEVARVQRELQELERRLAELNSSTQVIVSRRRTFAGGGEYLEDVVVGERAPL
jgi:hypothetical protein